MHFSKIALSAVAALAMGASGLQAATLYSQGFETDTAGWHDSSNGWTGTVTRVTGPLTPASGSHYATIAGDPYTDFGGYNSVWPGGMTASVAIYLDPAWSAGSGFDYSVAVNNASGSHLRDFIFHVTKDTSTGNLLVGASNNSSDVSPVENLESGPNAVIGSAGWYTFQQVFRDNGGNLAVDMNVLSSGGTTLFSTTLGNIDPIAGVGGNRYGWFTFGPIPTGLAIDDVSLTTVPTPAAAMGGIALLGLLAAKRRRS
jgi:hypothetical protein